MRRWVPSLLALSILAPPAVAQTLLDPCSDERAAGHCPGWVSTFGGEMATQEKAVATTLSPDGGTAVVIGTRQVPQPDYVTVAFDARTGERKWHAVFDGGRRDEANAVAISPDGARVYVTGKSVTGPPNRLTGNNRVDQAEPMTIAYDLATGDELWRSAGIAAEEAGSQGAALAVSPDGSILYVAGRSADPYNHRPLFYTMALNASTGESIWERPHTGTVIGAEAKDVALSPDGTTVYVTGEAFNARELDLPNLDEPIRPRPEIPATSDQDILTVAYDAATGAPKWQHVWNGTGNSYDYSTAVAIMPDGGVLVGGAIATDPESGWRDLLALRLDPADGTEEWNEILDRGRDELMTDLVLAPGGGRVFATGISRTWGDDAEHDHITVGWRTSDGEELWRDVQPGVTDDGEFADRLTVSADGTTVVQTHTDGPGYQRENIVTTTFDADTGVRRWQRIHNGGWRDQSAGVVAGPHGIIAAGNSVTGRGHDLVMTSFERGGGARWTSASGLTAPGGDRVIDSAATSDGATVLVAGWSVTGEDADHLGMHTATNVVALDAASGERRWVRTVWNGGEDQPTAIALSPDDRTLYVTGTSQPPNKTVTETLTYALDVATGAVRWTERYRPGSSEPKDLVVAPDGERLFVVGHGYGPGSCSAAAYDTATGRLLWDAAYTGPDGEDDACLGAAVSADGTRLGLTGRTHQGDNALLAMVADAATGQRRWRRTFNGPIGHHEQGIFAGFTPNGTRLVVAGESSDGPTTDVVTASFDAATGAPSWVDAWDGGAGFSDHVTGLHVTMNGIFTTAAIITDYDTTKVDIGIVKYHLATGQRMVQVEHDELLENQVATSSALSADGSTLVVTGYSPPPQGGDRIFTAAFETTFGEHLWSALYSDPNPAVDGQRVVIGGGRAFVTATPYWSGDEDYAVVAYALTPTD